MTMFVLFSLKDSQAQKNVNNTGAWPKMLNFTLLQLDFFIQLLSMYRQNGVHVEISCCHSVQLLCCSQCTTNIFIRVHHCSV